MDDRRAFLSSSVAQHGSVWLGNGESRQRACAGFAAFPLVVIGAMARSKMTSVRLQLTICGRSPAEGISPRFPSQPGIRVLVDR